MGTMRANAQRWIWWTAGSLLLAVAALALAAWIAARRIEPFLRGRLIAELSQRFHAPVSLESFHVRVADGLWVEGEGLRIGVPGADLVQNQQKAMIEADRFRFRAPLHYNPALPVHASKVEIEGLRVDLPPRSHFAHSGAEQRSPAPRLHFLIDALECRNATLLLETDRPGKLPLAVSIAELKLANVSQQGAMQFEAQLTNPKPAGELRTAGSFGPWQTQDPGETPLEGSFRLTNADLASFRGIAGRLDAEGRYRGTLRALEVMGQTRTPDFRLTHFGASEPLYTRFHATVDATNGDTQLQTVEATLGHSFFLVNGEVVRAVQQGRSAGHAIALNVLVRRGRLEDFLLLASHGGPPLLTGDLALKTTLEIPPGDVPVHQRMKLNGTFQLDNALFTSEKIQGWIGQLSARGQGRPDEARLPDASQTRSAMQSDFSLTNAVMALPDLQYRVLGAEIALKGSYGLDGGALNFDGAVKTQAPLSAMLGGWKGSMLRPFDRFFRKQGSPGTAIPLHVRGTEKQPQFSVEVMGMKIDLPAHMGGQ